MQPPRIEIDLKPASSVTQLLGRLPKSPSWAEIAKAWKLNAAARALLEFGASANLSDLPAVAAAAKAVPLTLIGPRPLAEAISSAGGVAWQELDEGLMLRAHPGIFLAGEMIDWEAPTGGYLLQGCFATGTRAASAALAYVVALSP
jgi:predicted flavoprotein YhiN